MSQPKYTAIGIYYDERLTWAKTFEKVTNYQLVADQLAEEADTLYYPNEIVIMENNAVKEILLCGESYYDPKDEDDDLDDDEDDEDDLDDEDEDDFDDDD